VIINKRSNWRGFSVAINCLDWIFLLEQWASWRNKGWRFLCAACQNKSCTKLRVRGHRTALKRLRMYLYSCMRRVWTFPREKERLLDAPTMTSRNNGPSLLSSRRVPPREKDNAALEHVLASSSSREHSLSAPQRTNFCARL
jgi:hypothetical protein